MKTKASRLFDDFNRRYWRGRLPRYRVICRKKLPGEYLGLCNEYTKTILLLKTLNEEDLRLTLLHEMCHIGGEGGGNQHGPAFLRKLHRLVRLGETGLMLRDIERYDGTAVERRFAKAKAAGESVVEVSLHQVIHGDLEAMAESPSTSRYRWPRIRCCLAGEYKMSEARLQRIFPWAEREWQRLSREARQYERLCQLAKEIKSGSQEAILAYRQLAKKMEMEEGRSKQWQKQVSR